MAAESLVPWVKVGSVLLRANEVIDGGNELTVVARVRDNTIAAALESMRPTSNYGRNTGTRMTWPGGTAQVRVGDVTSRTGAASARTITINATRHDEQRESFLDMATSGMTPDDLTEAAMRVSLFGEPNPVRDMAFMTRASNPLPAITELGLSEDSAEQVASILLSEVLVGERGVDHLTSLRLGPRHGGHRHLRLGWMPRRRYVNETPVERVIEGDAIVERWHPIDWARCLVDARTPWEHVG